MPELYTKTNDEIIHTDDMQDIITAVPSWILRWGITVFFIALVLIFSLSAFIRYPDIVKTSIRIESPNSPKLIVTKISGKLEKLLVKENDLVYNGQILGYLESTGNHDAILRLIEKLTQIQLEVNSGKLVADGLFAETDLSQLGELQSFYQTFYQQYIDYHSAINNGFYLRKKAYLQKDLLNLNQQRDQLIAQKEIDQKDYKLASQEYEMHQKLEHERVESPAEFRTQESKYLAKRSPLLQTESALITASATYAAKQKDILELDNQIAEAKSKFQQSLNSLISQAKDWKNKYVLTASQSGKLTFAGIVQENQVLATNQDVFYINPGNEQFFGEMAIPQINMGKVKEGQEVLIKLKSYPFEEYGMIRGNISYISDVPYRDSVFFSKVTFKIKGATDMRKPIHLKQGMLADAEIVTQDATILKRITYNLLKVINKD
ncbi:HlyD family secretion protein [Mucilaginibacter gracilis]|uniref:HlyD family secretion protein n=1 Tax=Mucilaginibacter gracilis TaxID=423350 RepID=A0A495IZY6_9SPHI|nr:HlyD family efflux transporter periplasmic adaptor subunit [Mucilaginibacter gracilis]RKR82042.1 HlyD family secretion protein [Mucilaginibacter gracilis]